MPLINLKTDLKSLRYGKDRIGGGDSGQPYIKSNIPEGFSSLGVLDNDFLYRGGITAVSESGKDVLRLGKMFGDLKSPNGLLFIAKQNILSKSAVKTQTSGNLNGGIYTPLSTLAQAGVNFTGYHLNKQGLNPFEQTGAYSNNENLYGVKIKPTQPVEDNRLFQLYNTKIVVKSDGPLLTYDGGPGATLGVGTTALRFASNQRTGENNPNYLPYSDYIVKSILDGKQQGGLKIDTNQPWNISEYALPDNDVNKPQSGSLNNTWYVGATTWTPHQDTNKFNLNSSKGVTSIYSQVFPGTAPTLYTERTNNSVYNSGSTFPDSTNPANFDNGTITYSQDQLNLASSYTSTGRVGDFRKTIREGLIGPVKKQNTDSGQLTEAPDYATKNIETRVKLGDPGNRFNKSYASYSKGPIDKSTGNPTGPLDKINASLPTTTGSTAEFNDLVRFNIATFDGWYMHFRAFLGAISDNYSGNLNEIQYVGRGEKFYSYNGFDRKISLSWTVAAQSKAELIPMYKKLSYLASNLAPIYKDGFMQGPLVKLTVGGYFHQLPGYITGLNFELGEDTPWEIDIDEKGAYDKTVSELPHIIKVSGFNFTPIPNYLPQKGAKFIDLYNSVAPNNTLWNANDTYSS